MFYDRYEAGRDVAEELTAYENTDAIVCAIPRGGVLTGVSVAKRLRLALEIMVVNKIEQERLNTTAICAVSELGSWVCDDKLPLDTDVVKQEVSEATNKRERYTDRVNGPDWKDKTVILIDDGAESGLTIKAAVLALLDQKPKKIVVALPAASESVTTWLTQRVDEVVVIKIEPEFRGTIKEHYIHYPDVFDKEVHVAYWHAKHMYDQSHRNA